MITIRDILTRIIALSDSLEVWSHKDLDHELLGLSRSANQHLDAANAANALTIHLDKVPAV